jgi:pyridoxal phosphate enzyme (YggS family)
MSLAARIDAVRGRIERAAAGRPVTLCAVSKTHPPEAIREAAAAGLTVFGESYAQELSGKRQALADLALAWHFIGHLQRNKVKDVVGVALIHGVDSLGLAETIDRRASGRQDVLVEVNLAGEGSKSGVAPAALDPLLEALAGLARVRCRGLMCIPPLGEDNRPRFRALATLARAHGLPELSMGMSDDYEVAIEEGATIVRVGTALFGERPPKTGAAGG